MKMMKKMICLLTVFFASLCTQNLIAQSSPKAVDIALVDGYLMFEKEGTGIKKLNDLKKQLAAEFKPRQDEITMFQQKLEELKKQIENNRTDMAKNRTLAEEAEKLQRDMRFKAEQYETQYRNRYRTLTAPINERISEEMKNWCKQKGYVAIMDVSKDEKGMIMWMDGLNVEALTLDLIKYLNTVIL